MKIPKNFGMKKSCDGSHTVRNTFLYALLTCAIVFSAIMATPWKGLQTSLIIDDSEIQTEVSELQPVLQEILSHLSKDEYVLTADASGTTKFIIPENTCKNGAKLTLELKDPEKAMGGSIQIAGLAPRKSRSVYSVVVAVDEEVSRAYRYLPARMIIDDETDFIRYTIGSANFADRVQYTVECY